MAELSSTSLTVASEQAGATRHRGPAEVVATIVGDSVAGRMGSLVKKRRKRMRKKKHKKMLRRTRHQRRK